MAGPKLGVRQGAPTTARNRGTQGYPVPPEQLAQVEPNSDLTDVLEDVVTKLVTPNEVTKPVPVGIVDLSSPLDLVTKAVVNDLVDQSEEQHRGTFFALKIPDAVAHRLAIPGGEPPEDLHVTLLYVKGLDPLKRKMVAALAREWSAKAIPLDIKIGGTGRFSGSPSSDGKDVIYLSVDSPGLAQMRQSLVMQLRDIGVETDVEHGWTPHITLKYVDPSEESPIQRLDPIHTQIYDTIIKESRIVEEPSAKPPKSQLSQRSQTRTNWLLQGDIDKLKRRGILLTGKSLGSGSRGAALEATFKGKRAVLKVTDDETEAYASNLLRDKPVKHLAHVYDVFKFPGAERFGILQEVLEKADSPEEESMIDAIWEAVHGPSNGRSLFFDWDLEGLIESYREFAPEQAPDFEAAAERFKLKEALAELRKYGIHFDDFHNGNVMKRGSDYVIIDLGFSVAPRHTEIPVLERAVTEATLRLLREAPADKVGVTIGRFQPFHKGHAALLRELSKKFSKVIVIVGGLKKDEANPFSFKLREKMMKASLPDVISKLEIHEAKYEGQNSGFVPGILSEIIDQNGSSLNHDMAVHILVGQDKVQAMKGQMAQALAMKEQGKELAFDPSLAEVTSVPNASEDGNGAASGTAIQQALEEGDEKAVAKMVDPHLLSDPTVFHEIYSELRKELGVRDVNESINAAGGLRSIEDTLDQNVEKLQQRRPFPVKWPNIRELGHGEDGYAYDMGGNKVFKVTTDPGEAISSHELKGQNTQSIVRIFDVFKFPPSQGNQGSRVPLYGIVTEKLVKLSSQEQEELNSALGWIMDPMFKDTTRQKFMRGDWPGTLHDIEQSMVRLLQAGEIEEAVGDTTANVRVSKPATQTQPSVMKGQTQTGRKMSSQEARTAAKSKVQTVKATLEKFNLPMMAKELAGKGIQFGDYHSGNLMKRGSKYVINDLGHSASKGGEPPVLEKITRTVMEDFAGPGNTAVGAKAGRSAWSAAMNPVDPDTEELWQNQLKSLNVQVGQTDLPGTIKNDPKAE